VYGEQIYNARWIWCVASNREEASLSLYIKGAAARLDHLSCLEALSENMRAVCMASGGVIHGLALQQSGPKTNSARPFAAAAFVFPSSAQRILITPKQHIHSLACLNSNNVLKRQVRDV
jgi:hypothetical protein